MKRTFLLLCVVRASLELQAVQHVYISKETRSDKPPVQNGFVITQVNNEPATVATLHEVDNPKNLNNSVKKECEKCLNQTTTEQVPTTTTKIENKSDAAPAASNMISSYTMNHMYHSDDEDIRTDSRNYYDGWPYLYHTPYDYNSVKFDIEVEKAKDKRFAESKMDRVIPVYEEQDDIPNTYVYTGPDYKHMQMYTTDNPIYGNKPFFSHILNDYYDKSYDYDPLIYKGNAWGREFDNEMPYQDIDYARSRRLGDEYFKKHIDNSYSHTPKESLIGHDTLQNSVSSKGYDKNRESESNEKGNDHKYNYKHGYEHGGKNFKEFKDFADAFANRFGAEDHDSGSKFSIKNKANKGEKKKGSRKVYHKDEYQEQNDFFDDADNSINTETHGASKFRVGGSEAYLGSQAAAAAGHEGAAMNKAENVETDKFEKKHEEYDKHKGMDSDFSVYRNLAKTAALSNDDYSDRYFI